MKVIIVEDEKLAIEHLEILLNRYDPGIEVVAKISSVQDTISWFSEHDAPDLAFFDIRLEDGSSFEALTKLNLKCPIIFTTAYNNYALKAFKVNSIDYLLKPFDLEELSEAIEKFKTLRGASGPTTTNMEETLKLAFQMISKQYKKRFLIKGTQHMHAVPVEDILFFYSANKIVWLMTKNGKKYATDFTLDQLEELVDPKDFFRLNRKYIVGFSSIIQVLTYNNNRLKVQLLNDPGQEDIIISRGRVIAFKEWFGL